MAWHSGKASAALVALAPPAPPPPQQPPRAPESGAPQSSPAPLDPKGRGKSAKSPPGDRGPGLTGTYAITKALGWDYLERLSKQGVQQLQSTTATPKAIASGERAVMVDGNEYNTFMEIDNKSPVKIIYPKEGTPFVSSPTAIFA